MDSEAELYEDSINELSNESVSEYIYATIRRENITTSEYDKRRIEISFLNTITLVMICTFPILLRAYFIFFDIQQIACILIGVLGFSFLLVNLTKYKKGGIEISKYIVDMAMATLGMSFYVIIPMYLESSIIPIIILVYLFIPMLMTSYILIQIFHKGKKAKYK